MNSVDLLSLVISLLIASLTAYLAKARGRNPAVWFFIGMMFNFVGTIALFLFPALSEEGKKEATSAQPVLELRPEKPNSIEDALSLKQWYYLDSERKQMGPVEFSNLQALWRNQAIKSSTYVWCEGMENWKKISDLADLSQRLAE